MRIKMLMGPLAGLTVDYELPVAESLVDTGFAEVVPVVERAVIRMETPEAPRALSLPAPSRMTLAALEDEGDAYGVNETDLEGTGAGGRIVKANWVARIAAEREARGL